MAHRRKPQAMLQSILCKSSSESTSFTRSEKGVRRTCRVYPATRSLPPSLSLSLLLSDSTTCAPPLSLFLCTMFLSVPFSVSRAHRGRLTSMGRHACRFSVGRTRIVLATGSICPYLSVCPRDFFSDSQCIILIDYSLRRWFIFLCVFYQRICESTTARRRHVASRPNVPPLPSRFLDRSPIGNSIANVRYDS